MRNVENKIIAAGFILNTALLIGIFFITLSLKKQKCECQIQHNAITAPIDKAIYENIQQIDSVFRNSDTSVNGAIRELEYRYRFRHNTQ